MGREALFRPEAMRYQSERLYGEVRLALPVAWQLIAYLLLAILVGGCAFLFMGSYSRAEAVSGAISLDTGVAAVAPSRSGIAAAVEVREGQRVAAGTPLVRVRAGEDLSGAEAASARIGAAMAEQDLRLTAQKDSYEAAAAAERARGLARIDGLTAEGAFLERQISDQRLLLTASEKELAEVQRVVKSGFISRRDVEAREAAVIQRRQQLAQLEQARSAKASELAEARRAVAQASASARAQVATAQMARGALAQQRTQAELAEGYVLRAPIAGTVTGLTARVGQRVTPDQALMMIIPDGGRPNAELQVPTSAAGFLARGQEVRLAIDAFPYQRFGTLRGHVESISAAARPAPDGKTPDSFYLVTVTLDRGWFEAFGARQPLRPGMSLSARIITARRTLAEWLFEPLIAVGKR